MYRDISDYGLIGDMHSVALVSNDGSIDYCSLPHIDSPTVFAALLDDEKGGLFRIQPKEKFSSQQQYIKDTNILKCVFTTNIAKAELIDFMPVDASDLVDKQEHSIHRCLKVTSGKMDFVLECQPRPHYAGRIPYLERKHNLFIIQSGNEIFSLIVKAENYEVIEIKDKVIIHFSLEQGQSAHFDFIYGKEYSNQREVCGLDRSISKVYPCGLDQTQDFWNNWLHNCVAGKCTFLGEYTDMINRSLLVLKLLSFQPTGAIAAAATTSLPESLGGERNWDYRFSWIRDASFTLKALFSLGHIREADGFIRWLNNTYERYGSRNLQIMYSVEGKKDIAEKILPSLKGYKNSYPVRVGNNAFRQDQWDIYGEIMDAALRLSDYAGKIDQGLWPFFRNICNLAIQNWKRPDYGIWEVRNGPRHFVYSKVMCWVALDRGIKIAKRYGFNAPLDKWEKEQNRIKEDILDKGYNKEVNSFTQCYESKNLDSSLMLLGLMDFLPQDDYRIKNTVNACKKTLLRKGFLMRYESDDGLKGEEGAFILCNFWFIESLALSGNIDEAKQLLDKTTKAANHLGLFSEEYDIKNRQMLGNFPQGFSHIGFINAVSSILNVQYRLSRNKGYSNLTRQISKLIPRKITLNITDTKQKYATRQIANNLKISFNNLQGAFFDVREGRVDYDAMRVSESYKDYLELAKKLNGFDPFSLKNDAEKKAFWINIYNILIIHGVIELDIHHSVKEVFNFFSRIVYSMGGYNFTPDEIEHGILRANRRRPGLRRRQFSRFDRRRSLSVSRFDPRVHFALVCASSSCPPIEFYTPELIDDQLDIATKSFINRRGIVFDKENNVLFLSRIFKWYRPDFGRNKQEMLTCLLNFMDRPLEKDILENRAKLTIRYLPYNWNLNKILK